MRAAEVAFANSNLVGGKALGLKVLCSSFAFSAFGPSNSRSASALGSGFIIKESGIVITNNHVITNAENILVRVGDKEYKAKLIGADPYMNVAVLKM